MDAPKPKPPVSRIGAPVQPQERVKQPYVRKPHLTDRPFQSNDALQKLKSDLARGNKR